MDSELTGYELSRQWFNFAFENTELISPNHAALYFYAIERWNRLGKKERFGLPAEEAKEAIGIKNYRTFKKTFDDLVEWGFFDLIQKSKNQFTANVIAIVKNTKANTKALDKAIQLQSQSIVGVYKQLNNETNKPSSEVSSEKKPLKLPFESERFTKLWAELTGLPKWKKKPSSSLIMTLEKLSRYEENFACDLISRAIEGNYQGVVFADTDVAYERWKKVKGNGQILIPTDERRQKLVNDW